MRRPTAAQLLTAWEAGVGGSWTGRAVLLAQLGHPELTADEVLALSIGDRDGRIFRMRRLLFGSRLDCTADCPRCGETLQTSLPAEDVLGCGVDSGAQASVRVGEHEVAFRLPTSADLFDLERDSDSGNADRRLMQACIVEANAMGQSVDPGTLPSGVLDAVSERMAEVDPCADVRLDLECPACRHRWEAPFDVVSHLWYEIEAWAQSVIQDVHALASAYGWREGDVLALTEQRRRTYLDLVDG